MLADGQVYRSPSGRPALYVREEGGRHLLIETRDRVVFQRWVDELPEELELALDPLAHERATEARNELSWARREVDALTTAMRRAVEVVPVEVANELRRVYRDTFGGVTP